MIEFAEKLPSKTPQYFVKFGRHRPAVAAKVKGEQTHAHFKDGSALNKDGTWKHGESKLSNAVQKWLTENGLELPK